MVRVSGIDESTQALVTIGAPAVGMGFLTESGDVITAFHNVRQYFPREVLANGKSAHLLPPPGQDTFVPVDSFAEPKVGKVDLLLTGHDPSSDIAVLSFVDPENLAGEDERKRWDELLKRPRLRVITDDQLLNVPLRVQICTLERKILSGNVTKRLPLGRSLALDFGFPPGTSGSPALTERAEAIGVASNAEGNQGRLVYLAMALPGWMLLRLRAAEAESGPR